MRHWKISRRRIAGGGVGIGLIAVVLGVQCARDRWPFSHHLEKPQDSRPVAPSDSVPSAEARAPVQVEPSKLGAFGVRVEAVHLDSLAKSVRAVATIIPDESRVSHVHTRVAGWVDRLYVNTTGEPVRAGVPLAGIFSQELLSSQTEYLAARGGAGMTPASAVLASGRSRLKVLGMTEEEIVQIETSGNAIQLVTIVAPRSGVVLHRGVTVGTAVDPSTELFTVVDLSRVWALAEVSEENIPQIVPGTPATLEFPASGLPAFESHVDFVYPAVTERTRTLRARFVVANESHALRPGVYGSAEFRVEFREMLTVPRDAVVDRGATQHVFVALGLGHFEPRTVRLGVRLPDRIEIRSGLAEGDTIVASGAFLIDSESRLQASGGAGVSHGGHGGSGTTPARGKTADRGTPAAAPDTATTRPKQDHRKHGE